MKPRFSLSRYALGHIALGLLALALFALSLWYPHFLGDPFWVRILGVLALGLLLGGVFAGRGRRSLLTELNEIKQAEQRYALAMSASDEAFWDWKVAGDELYVSPRFLDMFGFPPDTKFAGRAAMFKRLSIPAADREALERAVAEHFAGKTARMEIEFRVLVRGEERWIHAAGGATRDSAGVVVRWNGALRDVTARRRAEEALRVSEERYELAMAASESGYWDWQIPTDRYFASSRAHELSGFPRDHRWVNRADYSAHIPMHPEDFARWEAARKELFAGKGERLSMEVRYIVRGETRWHILHAICKRDDTGKVVRWSGSATDITERKLADEALRRSEARFRALTELWSDWYWEQDESLRFTYSSAAVSPPDGYPGGSAIGKTRWELPGIVPLSSSWTEHQAGLAARKPFRDFEYSRPAPDGTLRYISASGVPIFDEQGNFKGYQGMARNITESKRFEEALRLSEARYARAMDASADGLWEWNAATDELFTSPRARELWGIPDGVEIRTRAELKAQNLQFTEDTIRECIAQRSGVEMTYSVLNQAGELRWVRSMGKVFLGAHGEPMLVTGSLSDVTERKLGADALRLSEEELRARQDMLYLAQKAASAVAFEWYLGAGEGENRWSPDLEAMYGLEPGSYDGTYETWKKLVFPGDWPAVKAAIKRADETGDVAAEYRVVHPDGAVRWLQAKGRMFFDDERKPTRVVGFMLDVTDRHQAEEELRRLERQLRQAQRLEAMGTLAGGIAHDFNNILGAILGYGEIALRDAPKGSRLARDLDSIIVAGDRGRALVHRLLAFSRSGAGERVPVHVEKLVREALDLISAKLPPNVALRAKLRAGRAAMLGDATQVHQVVMNLATNAIQAMPAGGELRVSLDVMRLESARVPTIGIIDPGEYLVLEVADSGTGIPPDVLERIFDPFFTTKEVGTGTGLGLSLVHGIVAELCGAVDVTSTPGAGSTFTVYLPRNGESVDAPLDEKPEMPRGDGQRVLVVDDEEPLVRLATRTLEELGYAPVGFTSSSAALAAFRADPQRFDALITDERMPGMSGSALIREVRGIRSSMPVVLMSGYLGATGGKARESGLLHALGRAPKVAVAIGADEVLQKPLSARDLATSLAKVLRL